MQIREARIDDAVEVCRVLRRSIVELCRADHQDDPSVLEEWLRNKTPDQARSWITNPESYIFVATDDAAIIGVGAVSSSGQILLNYVSPDARFRGVSKAILNQMESKALELGHPACAVISTATARRFYRSAGYEQQGAPAVARGVTGYPMVKQLSPAATG